MKSKSLAAGCFTLCPKTGRHLMLKRRKGVKYENYWGFPGGSFDEEDGNPKVTAIREFREETGYMGSLKIMKQPLLVERSNHIDFYAYLCIVDEEFVPDLKGEMEVGNESENYAWFELGVISKKMMPTVIEILNKKKKILLKAIENEG